MRVFVEVGLLFKKGFNQAPFRCIADDEVAKVLQEIYAGECNDHQGALRLFKQIMLGYYCQ